MTLTQSLKTLLQEMIKKGLPLPQLKGGGYGIPKSREFIIGLGVGLFKKHLIVGDSWSNWITRAQIIQNYPFYIDLNSEDLRCNPFSLLIASAFKEFRSAYYKNKKNWLKAPILTDDTPLRNSEGQKLNISDMSENLRTRFHNATLQIRPFDLINQDNFLILERNRIGIPLSEEDYDMLKNLITANHQILSNSNPENCLDIFMGKIKKGSKQYRNILNQSYPQHGNFSNKGYTYRCNILSRNPIYTPREMGFNVAARSGFLPNWVRSTATKYLNGRAYLNDRLSKFVPNVNNNCSFCPPNQERYKETLMHITLDCIHVKSVATNFFNLHFNLDIPPANIPEVLLLGSNANGWDRKLFENLLILIFITYLLGNKRFPIMEFSLLSHAICILKIGTSASRKFKNIITKFSDNLGNNMQIELLNSD